MKKYCIIIMFFFSSVVCAMDPGLMQLDKKLTNLSQKLNRLSRDISQYRMQSTQMGAIEKLMEDIERSESYILHASRAYLPTGYQATRQQALNNLIENVEAIITDARDKKIMRQSVFSEAKEKLLDLLSAIPKTSFFKNIPPSNAKSMLRERIEHAFDALME